MTQSTANVAAASPLVTGGVLRAPLGTTLPTGTTAALDAAFVALGYVSDSGLEPSGDATSTKDIFAWGGDLVASVVESKSTRKFKFTLIEVFNEKVNNAVFGDANVTVTPATVSTGTLTAILDKGDESLPECWAFDMAYDGKKMRVVAANAQLRVLSELPMVHTDLRGYECEVTCLADDSGVRVYRYLDDGVFSA